MTTHAAPMQLTSSVIVCTYTEARWPLIRQAVASIWQQTVPPDQIVLVVDHNANLYRRLAAEYADLLVVPNTFERGLSGARNTGVGQAKGDILVFLDDDARAEPGWLESLLASYSDESVLGVGGLVQPDWGPAGPPGWLPGEFLWVVGCSYVGLPGHRAEVRNPVGANMSFRRSAFDIAGLFNPAIGRTSDRSRPLGCEETEFSIRLRRLCAGGKILYEPGAVVRHTVGPARGTWRYFLSRCYAEGSSKAQVAGLAGASVALSSERSYVRTVIGRALLSEISALGRPGGRSSLGRLAALLTGLSWTTAGYLRSTLGQWLRIGRGKATR